MSSFKHDIEKLQQVGCLSLLLYIVIVLVIGLGGCYLLGLAGVG